MKKTFIVLFVALMSPPLFAVPCQEDARQSLRELAATRGGPYNLVEFFTASTKGADRVVTVSTGAIIHRKPTGTERADRYDQIEVTFEATPDEKNGYRCRKVGVGSGSTQVIDRKN